MQLRTSTVHTNGLSRAALTHLDRTNFKPKKSLETHANVRCSRHRRVAIIAANRGQGKFQPESCLNRGIQNACLHGSPGCGNIAGLMYPANHHALRKIVALSLFLLLAVPAFAATAARDWHTGMLMETEQEKVPSGSISHSNADVTAKDKGDKTQYSGTKTTTTTQDYDTFQIYTVEGGNKIYTAKEQLLFPWSKPANVTVGEKVKYVIDKNRMYLLDDDGKEHKAKITKVKMKSAE